VSQIHLGCRYCAYNQLPHMTSAYEYTYTLRLRKKRGVEVLAIITSDVNRLWKVFHRWNSTVVSKSFKKWREILHLFYGQFIAVSSSGI